MFSCVLLRCGDKQEDAEVLWAERATVDVQVVSSLGRGTAVVNYIVEESKELVLCIPNTVSSRNGCTQEVKVTGCHFDMEKEGKTTLKLAKQDEDYPILVKNLPSPASVRRSLHGHSSISPNDTIIYLGRFESKSELTVHIEFLLRLPLNSSPQHILENVMFAKKLSYSLNYASYAQILDVSLSCSVLEKFDWKFKDKSRQMTIVMYETVPDLHELEEVPSVTIKLAPEATSQSACCMCLSSSGKNSSPIDGLGMESSQDSRKYDGVMIASSRVTPEQLAVAVPRNGIFESVRSSRCVSPSEFIFLVDCSVSMNPFLDSVTSALITCIKSLPEGCYFNVIAFGSSFRQLFCKESAAYSRDSVSQAVDFVNRLKANLGGTELLPSLRWIFKNARKCDMPCQVFIITDVDQEVKDVPYILKTIRKNRSYTRCHTFGIGTGICRSLVVGVAEAGQGQCVLLEAGERLQTKVMEVMQESLEPALMDAGVRFRAPPGYAIMESIPRSQGVAFSRQDRLSFAFLKKNSNPQLSTSLTNGFDSNGGDEDWDIADGDNFVPATLEGCAVGGKRVKLPIQEAAIPQLSMQQLKELIQLLTQMGLWTKIEEKEIEALQANSRKSSIEEEDRDGRENEPSAKRQRLNGDMSVPLPLPSIAELRGELMSASIDAGIPCSYTYFRGTSETGRNVIQLVPHRQQQSANSVLVQRRKNGIVSHYQRPHQRKPKPLPSASHSSFSSASSSPSPDSLVSRSMTSLSALVSKIFQTTPMDVDDEGKTLEDEEKLQKLRKTQPSWGHGNKLKYPQSYYQTSTATSPVSSSSSSSSSSSTQQRTTSTSSKSSGHNIKMANGKIPHLGRVGNGYSESQFTTGHGLTSASLLSHSPLTSGVHSQFCSPIHQRSTAPDNSSCHSSDDEDDDPPISDTESDTSLDLETLPKTRQYLGIIQSQLFSGAWSLERSFYGAIRVSKRDIESLPLRKTEKCNGKWTPNMPILDQETSKGLSPVRQEHSKPHFWCTVLAVVCFRECFPELEVEWSLVVTKGVDWIKRNLDECGLEIDEVYAMARSVLFKDNSS